MKTWVLLVSATLLLLLPVIISAQSSPPLRCAADEYLEAQLQDPEYALKFRLTEGQVRGQLNGRTPSCVNPIIIPVAVHFSGSITNANLSCIQSIVDDQLAVLNEDFGGYNADIATYCNHASNCPTDYPPTALAGGTCIQFCLATMDHPAGSGLSNGESAFTFGQFTFDSGASPWAGYFNIFVSDVPPMGFGSNILGVAPLFGGADPDGNGMFIIASSFGGDGFSCSSGTPLNNSGSYNLGRTGTHEAGHYFGLYHVFEGCGNGDFIADTPDQETDNGGAPTINYGSCTSTANNSCGTQDFFFNYMDYVVDASMYMFTSDQSDVMNVTATTGANHGTNPYRTAATVCGTTPGGYNPTYPTGCPASAPPESAFSINATLPYEFCPTMNEIMFLDESTNFPTAWSWTFSGAGVTPSSSTDQNPTVTVSATGTLTVTLTASNSAGSDLTPASMNYSITILPPASCGSCGESFFDTGGSGGNYANNEDEIWTFCTADPGDVLVVDFSAIDIGNSSFEDYLLVSFGSTPATGLGDEDFLVMLGNIYEPQGGGFYAGLISTTITSSTNCLTFRFLSDASGTTAGWAAQFSCIVAPTCSDGQQNQDEVFVDCGGATCAACPTPEEGFTFYDVGGAGHPAGSNFETWQICASSGNNTILDFTTIDMTPFNNGILRVYDGPDNSGGYDYYISGTAIYVPVGMGLTPFGSNMITSTNECFFFDFFNGSETSNGWAAAVSSSASLPLRLNAFRARPSEAAIALNWTTTNEINVDEFIIERRAGLSASFVRIGTKSACGNCPEENRYQFNDASVRAGVNYTYRLKMMDVDGRYEYSDMVTASIKGSSTEWSVYPNPNKGTFTLTLEEGHQATTLQIVDQLGQIVFQSAINLQDRFLNLALSNLPSGVYQVVLRGKALNEIKPLVIIP